MENQKEDDGGIEMHHRKTVRFISGRDRKKVVNIVVTTWDAVMAGVLTLGFSLGYIWFLTGVVFAFQDEPRVAGAYWVVGGGVMYLFLHLAQKFWAEFTLKEVFPQEVPPVNPVVH